MWTVRLAASLRLLDLPLGYETLCAQQRQTKPCCWGEFMLSLNRAAIGIIAALLAAVAVFAASPAAADNVADFYKGKTVTILMGTGPGGSFDLYGRTIAEHFSRHIPGHPNIIIGHMPGAGGVIAANNVYNTAPQDGTVILESHAIATSQMLTPAEVRFKSEKFNWLGAYDAIVHMMTV